MKNNQLIIAGVSALILIAGAYYFSASPKASPFVADPAIAATFNTLKASGNSSCSADFAQSVKNGTTGSERLKGSCCSPMDLHRYSEQVTGLKKYASTPEIPSDPYNIDAALAQKLTAYYDTTLTPDEQKVYDYAMANSMEKGPCCCKCWRWYVYGGLAKLLIQKYHFTGEQITEVWNLSDGCGGPGSHVNHS